MGKKGMRKEVKERKRGERIERGREREEGDGGSEGKRSDERDGGKGKENVSAYIVRIVHHVLLIDYFLFLSISNWFEVDWEWLHNVSKFISPFLACVRCMHVHICVCPCITVHPEG